MNRIVYVLEFPLVRNDRFILYRLYSIPIKHPDSSLYSTILPELTYLATSTTRQNYVIANSLENCKAFAPDTRVCKDLPVYNINTRPTCEMEILVTTDKEVPKICEVTTFAAHINTFQPLENNKWIFILRHKTSYVLECGDKVTNDEVSGSGIIYLDEEGR